MASPIPDSWDEPDFEPPPPGPKIKSDRWEGEDEDENVKDNWDDDDEANDTSKSEGKSSGSKPLQPKKKTPRQLREEQKRKEAEERERAKRALQPKTADELLAERIAKQKILESSDLKLAEEIFAGAGGQITVSFESVKLETVHEFESFRRGLVDKLLAVSNSSHYALFVEDLLRDICAPIDIDDLRKIQASLNALYNEKNKKDKPANKKKGKKAPTIKVDNELSLREQPDAYDDLDDII